jgi:hypothetical protein
MPLNLTKTYNRLLELDHLSEYDRKRSLHAILERDISENINFSFRGKKIWPLKTDGSAMATLFSHLTTELVFENEKKTPKRIYEPDRSKRVHWIKYHIEEKTTVRSEILVFSSIDHVNGEQKSRTYIYDRTESYLVVLEPQRTKTDYYLLTAYYLNRKEGIKTIEKKIKRKLPDIL